MFHAHRTWCVARVGTAPELAEKLTEHSWTLCTAFELEGYLFLNDATSEDGAAEFAVLKRPESDVAPFLQVESITFSWCDQPKALEYIRQTLRGEFDRDGRPVRPALETSGNHGTCVHCA